MPFTEESAWGLIADLLEEGHPVREVTLKTPPGKAGFEMLVDLEGATQTLYIKLEMGARFVIGRSFHYSDKSGLHGTPRGK